MKKLLLLCFLVSCTANEQTLLFECEQQNSGEACYKLGKAKSGPDALLFFHKGCELGSTNGCVSAVEVSGAADQEETKRVLKIGCEKGNPTACGKFKELTGSPEKAH